MRKSKERSFYHRLSDRIGRLTQDLLTTISITLHPHAPPLSAHSGQRSPLQFFARRTASIILLTVSLPFLVAALMLTALWMLLSRAIICLDLPDQPDPDRDARRAADRVARRAAAGGQPKMLNYEWKRRPQLPPGLARARHHEVPQFRLPADASRPFDGYAGAEQHIHPTGVSSHHG